MEWLKALITPIVAGIVLFLIEWRHLKKEKEHREKLAGFEQMLKLMYRDSRASNILITATAKAVQRIPDAHCNGDMKKALEDAEKVQKEENDFFVENGIKHLVGE